MAERSGAEARGWRGRVAAATVRLPGKGGRGVLVSGGLVLTATHCIGWDGTGGLVLGDHDPVPVETADGHKFSLAPWYADAVSDMATLGLLDNQEFPDDEATFDEWREQTAPVPLSPWIPRTPKASSLRRALRPPSWDTRPVWLLSLDGRWTRGRVTKYGYQVSASVGVEADEAIQFGMSGGPVVDAQGRLVGVVSWGSAQGAIPLARLALPGWLVGRIAGGAPKTTRRPAKGGR